MITTIDRAGRIVVPKSLRDQFNLAAGTEIEVEAVGDGLRLRKAGAEPSLIRKRGVLVHHGSSRVNIDIGEFVRAERNVHIHHATDNTA